MSGLLSTAFDKKATALSLVLGLVAILGAWGSQFWGGLVPCELCWGERVPYYWGVPLLMVILAVWNRLPLTVWYIAMAVAAAIFAWSTWLGTYHAGVEWKFWPGPTACTTAGSGGLDLSQLSDLNAVKVVPCDVVQFRFLGISLAGYNALISLAIVLLLIAAIVWQAQRRRQRLAAA